MMTRSLAVLAAVVAVASAECTGKDVTTVKACYDPYVKYFGFPVADGLPAYWDMHGKRKEMLFDKGLEIQPAITAVGSNLVNCMQPYWTCIDTDTYVNSFAQNASDGLNWLTDLAVTQYEVSARGYFLQRRHFYGFQICGVKGSVGQAMAACSTALQQEMTAHNANACNNQLACVFKAFGECLGPEGGEYMCGTQRAGLGMTYKTNPTVCQMGACATAPAAESIAFGEKRLKFHA